jgi:hypothetical protein
MEVNDLGGKQGAEVGSGGVVHSKVDRVHTHATLTCCPIQLPIATVIVKSQYGAL